MANHKKSALNRFLALSAAIVLSACGGGGDPGRPGAPPDDPSPAAKAEGAYEGTLTGSASSAFQLIVLENDEFWALYGTRMTNVFLVRGFIQGQGSSSNGAFTSSNARDFGFAIPAGVTVDASYVANSSVTGNIVAGSGTVRLSGTAIPKTSYDYSKAALLGDIVGAWTLGALDGTAVALNVADNGSFTANAGGCAIAGTMTPRPSGKNVFTTLATFGGAPCAEPGFTASGITVTYRTNSGLQQLVVAGVNVGRTSGTALFGTR